MSVRKISAIQEGRHVILIYLRYNHTATGAVASLFLLRAVLSGIHVLHKNNFLIREKPSEDNPHAIVSSRARDEKNFAIENAICRACFLSDKFHLQLKLIDLDFRGRILICVMLAMTV